MVNRGESRKLFKMASQNKDFSIKKLDAVIKNLKGGADLDAALKKGAKHKTVSIQFGTTDRRYKRIVKEYGTINKFIAIVRADMKKKYRL